MAKDDNDLINKLAVPLVVGFLLGGIATFTQVQVLAAKLKDIDSSYLRRAEIKMLQGLIESNGCD